MNDLNALQPFMFQEAQVRGQIVRLEHTYQMIINQHPYPDMIKHLLGEALASCLLLTGSIKFEGDLSLQFQGDHRLPHQRDAELVGEPLAHLLAVDDLHAGPLTPVTRGTFEA